MVKGFPGNRPVSRIQHGITETLNAAALSSSKDGPELFRLRAIFYFRPIINLLCTGTGQLQGGKWIDSGADVGANNAPILELTSRRDFLVPVVWS